MRERTETGSGFARWKDYQDLGGDADMERFPDPTLEVVFAKKHCLVG